MTREEAILWMQVLKHAQINWVGEQAEDEDIIARCEESEQEAFDMAIEALQADAEPTETSTLGEKHQLSHGRLIDADELKKHLDGAWEELNDDGERKGVRLARWYLISAPTVDSTIDVVRCKDCCHRVHDEERGLYYCEMYYGQGDVSDENFCQWGERKEK